MSGAMVRRRIGLGGAYMKEERVALDAARYPDAGASRADEASSSRNSYIPTLDGLRAAAIMLVILSHAMPAYWKYSGVGHIGVLLFFALSGYLITTKLLDEYQKTGEISLRNFYFRRAFRILPPAVAYLAILGSLAMLGLVSCDAQSIMAALLFWVNYIPVQVVAWKAGHFWSLSVEEHFYLLWPSLLTFSGVISGWRAALAVALAICLWRSTLMDWRWAYHTDYIADALLWGCVLAFIPKMRIAAASLMAVLLSASLWCLEFGSFNANGRVEVLLEHVLPAALLGTIVMAPRSGIGRLLELALVRFVGRLSYSLYIWQQMFLGGKQEHLPLPVALLCVFVAAYVSYRWVEQPAIRFGRRWVASQGWSPALNSHSR